MRARNEFVRGTVDCPQLIDLESLHPDRDPLHVEHVTLLSPILQQFFSSFCELGGAVPIERDPSHCAQGVYISINFSS